MPFGTAVHRLESVASTNDAARDLAQAGAAHGTAVVAREQSRGRGTKGRAWHSPAGLGLYASFIIRGPGGGPVPSPHLLPLAAGLAASDAIAAGAGIEVRLKWPNDLVLGGRKVGLHDLLGAFGPPDGARRPALNQVTIGRPGFRPGGRGRRGRDRQTDCQDR